MKNLSSVEEFFDQCGWNRMSKVMSNEHQFVTLLRANGNQALWNGVKRSKTKVARVSSRFRREFRRLLLGGPLNARALFSNAIHTLVHSMFESISRRSSAFPLCYACSWKGQGEGALHGWLFVSLFPFLRLERFFLERLLEMRQLSLFQYFDQSWNGGGL